MLSVTGASGAALLQLGMELGAAEAVGTLGVANAATPTAGNLAAKPGANPGAKATVKGSPDWVLPSVRVSSDPSKPARPMV